jgi:putative component of membrane protein insertase Oxa1/YidC/SpoIIIJ protein YidD
MEISPFNCFTRQVGVSAITVYQQHISPHKGFACAHRVLYGDESCSQYFKRVIAENGFRAALMRSRQRFQACKQAHTILRAQAEKQPPKPENPNNERLDCNDYLTGAECVANCAEVINDSPGCDALDCSGADCSFLDCGSCSP